MKEHGAEPFGQAGFPILRRFAVPHHGSDEQGEDAQDGVRPLPSHPYGSQPDEPDDHQQDDRTNKEGTQGNPLVPRGEEQDTEEAFQA